MDRRLTKVVFLSDYQSSNRNWCWEVGELFDKLGIMQHFVELRPVDLDWVKPKILSLLQSEWENQVNSKPKLRTYRTFKRSFGAEEYVCNYLNRYRRSLYAQLRCGVLPLNIEVGRFRGVPADQRFCPFCIDKVESEYHFVIECPKYQQLRDVLFNELSFDPTFISNDDGMEQFTKLMSFYYKEVTVFIANAWKIRQQCMFHA